MEEQRWLAGGFGIKGVGLYFAEWVGVRRDPLSTLYNMNPSAWNVLVCARVSILFTKKRTSNAGWVH